MKKSIWNFRVNRIDSVIGTCVNVLPNFVNVAALPCGDFTFINSMYVQLSVFCKGCVFRAIDALFCSLTQLKIVI